MTSAIGTQQDFQTIEHWIIEAKKKKMNLIDTTVRFFRSTIFIYSI